MKTDFYMLIDNHTDQIFRTKSGRIKKFKTPDDACEYMHETIDNLNFTIVDQDEAPVLGW
jgi:predicted HAD superfamily hydrolase